MRIKSGHIVELQSLRGIAATAVAVGHCLTFYTVPGWFHRIAVLANGRAAVVIFFVLSGYVLTRSLRNTAFDTDTILNFYVQRVFRIYPAMLAASLLGLWYIYALHWQIPVERSMFGGEFRVDRYDSLHIIASFAGMTTFVMPQVWTIFIEIVASIAMPAIAFVALYRRQWLAALIALGFAAGFAIPSTYYHISIYFVDFLVGAALAVPGQATRLFGRVPASPAVAGLLLLWMFTQWLPFSYWSPVPHVVEVALAAAIIGIMVGAQGGVEFLRSPRLLFLGDVSFSVYLWQYPIMCIVATALQVAQNATVQLGPIPLALINAVITMAITIPLAGISFIYIEKPGVQLGKLALNNLRKTT